MPSPKSLQVISALSRLCYRITFAIIPFLCKLDDKEAHLFKHKKIKQKVLLASNFIGFIVIAVQLIRCVFQSQYDTPVGILFYSFLLVVLVFIVIFGFGLSVNVHEFRCLFCILAKNPYGFVVHGIPKLRSSGTQRQDRILLALILIVQLAIAIFFLVLIPVVDIALTVERHNSCNIFGPLCSLNVAFILLKTPLFVVLCIISMLTISIELIFVKPLSDNLKHLVTLISYNQDTDRRHKFQLVSKYYSQIQIYTILVNKCLQTYVWPIVEFLYGFVSIGLAYIFIKYHVLFNIFVKTIVAGALLTNLCFIHVMFDYGSQPLSLSCKIITKTKLFQRKDGQSILLGKVLKSCRLITLKVGLFHKIDQTRGPSLVRYILQRTVFLLLKSKDGDLRF